MKHTQSGRHRIWGARVLPGLLVGLFAIGLSSCQVQWVSPYNADLQQKATAMLSDVVSWEAQMRNAAGTAAADPRNPQVQQKLAAWQGDIEAMAQIEVGIDPGSTSCDKFLQTVSTATLNAWSGLGKISPPSVSGLSMSAPQAVTHCESLPGIFTRMQKAVTATIPTLLDQQCKLPWLSDDYFAALKEAQSTAGAATPARPPVAAAKAGTPTGAQAGDAVTRCKALFESPDTNVTPHGNLVDSLVTDLDAIIYREGREAPPSTANK